MAVILSIVNQKGGVGKTTTAVNLAAALTVLDKNVLLVDIDPQGNASTASGLPADQIESDIANLLLGEADFSQAVHFSEAVGYSVLPATESLVAIDVQLRELPSPQLLLRRILGLWHKNYDYILIDCPPALGLLTINAMLASQGILVPVQCEYYALEGLSRLLDSLRSLQELHPALRIYGLVRTMYDGRNRLSQEVTEQLKSYFGELLYETAIPRNVRIAEAPGYGLPVVIYDRDSKGAQAYLALAQELIDRTENQSSSASVNKIDSG